MKLDKILLYVEPKSAVDTISRLTINLARSNNARVFALSIIQHPTQKIKTRIDEQAWKRLYEIEEDAFEAGIKISLLLEELEKMSQDNLTQKLIDLSKSYRVDLIIFSSSAKININKLSSGITIPIFIVPPQNTNKPEIKNDSIQWEV
jgi:hypothetical protein